MQESARPPSLPTPWTCRIFWFPLCGAHSSESKAGPLALQFCWSEPTWAIRAAISRASSLLTGNLPATLSVSLGGSSRQLSLLSHLWLDSAQPTGEKEKPRTQLESQAMRLSLDLYILISKEKKFFIPFVSLFSTASRKFNQAWYRRSLSFQISHLIAWIF